VSIHNKLLVTGSLVLEIVEGFDVRTAGRNRFEPVPSTSVTFVVLERNLTDETGPCKEETSYR
jgi:hypothetical protein